MYIQKNTDSAGKKKFDLPLSKAFEAEEVTKKIITEEQNYIRAKVQVNVGKVYIAKRSVASKEESQSLLNKADHLFTEALSWITSLYTDSHPLAAKYNQHLIEAFNLRPES